MDRRRWYDDIGMTTVKLLRNDDGMTRVRCRSYDDNEGTTTTTTLQQCDKECIYSNSMTAARDQWDDDKCMITMAGQGLYHETCMTTMTV